MNTCKMCKEQFHPENPSIYNEHICEVCFEDDFDGLELEDKVEILMGAT
jgi:hypothetical protein